MDRETHTIRQLGPHRGKTIVLGFDRYLLPELESYLEIFNRYGAVAPVGECDKLHYLTSAKFVCEHVQETPGKVGVLICGTGLGMSIAANKFRGIYATRCVTVEDGSLARTINNSNVLCLASMTGIERNGDIIDAFMSTPYAGRKLDQLEYITELELESQPAPRAKLPDLRVVRQTA